MQISFITKERADAMEKETIKQYKSRRNEACLVRTDTGRSVKKTFTEESAFQRELQIYRLLENADIPCARVLSAEGRTLVLTELPGENLVDCLAQQEAVGQPLWDVWDKLAAWLIGFHRHTGFVMTDVNLRNFLYDEASQTLYGLDFEECAPGSLLTAAAGIAAFVRTYAPANTPLKREISQYILNLFARSCSLDLDDLLRESGRQEATILERRNKRI